MGGWRPPSFAHDGLRRPAPLHAVSDECLRSAAFHGSAVRRTTAASPRGRAASPRPAPRAHGVVRELIRTPAAAEGRGQAQTGAHFRHSESAARPRRGRSSSGSGHRPGKLMPRRGQRGGGRGGDRAAPHLGLIQLFSSALATASSPATRRARRELQNWECVGA